MNVFFVVATSLTTSGCPIVDMTAVGLRPPGETECPKKGDPESLPRVGGGTHCSHDILTDVETFRAILEAQSSAKYLCLSEIRGHRNK